MLPLGLSRGEPHTTMFVGKKLYLDGFYLMSFMSLDVTDMHPFQKWPRSTLIVSIPFTIIFPLLIPAFESNWEKSVAKMLKAFRSVPSTKSSNKSQLKFYQYLGPKSKKMPNTTRKAGKGYTLPSKNQGLKRDTEVL